MKRISLICIVSLFALMGVAKSLPSTYVEVLYFHGKQRCATCICIEKYAREVVEKQFAAPDHLFTFSFSFLGIFS